ncbi:hypothetical protein [Pseudothauera rhizosphaerae]|uniref:Uncharacterized protein n=1 Tax=Pseudothauera rhizosphaerae TaxID=2565932 RepID=A0A4S4AYE2_9RHOO|nr:hypothetical protein [Pseudothauera rhizosphaerae]THF64348.1 hypothetical protein E6O51_03290 [Pseudothauera rhizosphaerae]
MSITPQQLSRIVIAHNLTAIDAHLARDDETERRNEAIEAAADLIWRKRIAMPGKPEFVRPDRLREGITEVMGTADDDEIAELAQLAAGNVEQFGRVLEERVRDYWLADCMERARQQIDRMEREDAAEDSRSQTES